MYLLNSGAEGTGVGGGGHLPPRPSKKFSSSSTSTKMQ